MNLAWLDPAMWARIEPYVDKAFDLERSELDTWLRELTVTEPRIASAVRELLHERDRLYTTDFLEGSPLRHAPSNSMLGKHVGAYTVEKLLGRGGMGQVWLAARHDGRFDGYCAIKVLDALVAHPHLVDRFHREGRLLARLVHPHIARLIDAGTTQDGRPYLALEYINGEHIDRYCSARDISVRGRVGLFVDVVSAVAHAHRNLIVHRDLKPSNVVVTRDGAVKLLDFGIAKLLSSERSDETHTRVEDTALTPEYAAPEQLLGEPPSTATDVYQLGALLYVLLTGRLPLQGTGSRSERIKSLLNRTIPYASESVDRPLRGALRGDLDAILAKALRRDPGERYATAAALGDDLMRYLEGETVAARRGATFYRTRKFVARHRWLVFGAAVAALGLCAVSLIAIDQAGSARRQALIASQEVAKATAANRFLVRVFSGALIGSSPHKPPGEMTAAELLDSSSSDMVTSLDKQPELMLELIRVVGDIFTVMDDVDKSLALYRRGIEFSEKKFGANNPMKAELLVRIANDELGAGRIAAANEDVAVAEAAVKAQHDEQSRYYATLLMLKGNLLLMKGSKFAAAAKIPLRHAAALFAERYADDSDLPFTLIYLAHVHMLLNEDAEAERTAEQAVRTANNPDTRLTDQAGAFSIRASIRQRLGKLELAEADYLAASSLFVKSVGAHHPSYVMNEGERGELLQLTGRRADGLALIEATTAQLESTRNGTAIYGIAARRLAQAYLRDGSYDRAVEASIRAISLLRPLHLSEPLAQELLNQAEALIALGRLSEAERCAVEATQLMQPQTGVQPPALGMAQYILGAIALARGNFDAASEFARRAQAATKETNISERTRRVRIYILESQIALARSDTRAALDRAQQATQLVAKDGANSNPFVRAEVAARHGVALCRAQRPMEGQQLLTEGLNTLRNIRSPSGYPLEELDRELAACK